MSQPPAEPHELRASDADRDRTAEVLRDALGEGRITLEELDERLTQVYAAKTYAELEPITRDLPATGTIAPPDPAVAAPRRVGGTPKFRLSLAILGAATRKGAWVVPSSYTAVSVLGGVELDLREATFACPEATIQAYSVLGGVKITVPEDIEVDVSGIGILGNVDHGASGPGVPGAPKLRIIGVAVLGGIEVVRRRPRRSKKALTDTDTEDWRESLRSARESRHEVMREVRESRHEMMRELRQSRRHARRPRS